MKATLLQYFDDFIHLLYPNLCNACNEKTPLKDNIVCLSCQYHLTKTNLHLEKENLFTQKFWGRIQLHSAAALFYYVKGGRTQQLIHNLKYKNKREVGIYLGEMYGKQLIQSPHFSQIDYIIPIPLHPRKQRKRGFNQSDLFAKGLSESMQIPWLKNGLHRIAYTTTQTQKTRMERLQNVEKAFIVNPNFSFENKHLLIVDDVFTTGATLEAAAIHLLKIPGVKISFATIAIAKH